MVTNTCGGVACAQESAALLSMELFTPPFWGRYIPIDVNTHTQTVLPHWGVCTVLVVKRRVVLGAVGSLMTVSLQVHC